jgi:hypothetical protein
MVALVLYFDAGLLLRLFQVTPVPEPTIWLRMFASVVFLFGLVYYAAGIDLRSNASLIRLGAIAKLGLVLVAAIEVLAGAISWQFMLLLLPDVIFAMLFFRALRGGWRSRVVRPGAFIARARAWRVF